VLCLFLSASLVPLHSAELKLAAIFSDHMVLQREKPVPIWGWANPAERITVDFAGQKIATTADAGGKWEVKLNPMTTSAESRKLVVQSEVLERKVEVADVLVGEVWLGSGQSNMGLQVQSVRDFQKERAAAKLPLIRMFKAESPSATTPQLDTIGQWSVCSPKTVGSFSATLFFFGRELYAALGVPIGLINSSLASTPIESWIASDAQDRVPELNNPIQKQNRRNESGRQFNSRIAPLIPYALRGVVWYQGERNTRAGAHSPYQYQLSLLVNDWRSRWGEELPFAWVQLPNFQQTNNDWAIGWVMVREAMLKTLRLPHTGMAITVDIGDSNNVHPKNKQDVGKRLSLWALGEVYSQKVASTCGPLPRTHEVHGSELTVAFTHTDGGLVAKAGALRGFIIAGEDRQWKPAQARIKGESIIVSSSEVTKPVAVRYAWEADPKCNLLNGAGLPASPFRTDDWDISGLEEKEK